MQRQAVVLILTVGVLSCGAAVAGDIPFESEPLELVAPENVMIIVKRVSAWRPNLEISALSCDGRFRIVGAYSDTTAIRGTVPPDSAIAIVNELLALNFFELPPMFGSTRYQLELKSNVELGALIEKSMDAGMDTITLVIGSSQHEVSLAYPAHGAPAALHHWIRRYLAFMKKCRGW